MLETSRTHFRPEMIQSQPAKTQCVRFRCSPPPTERPHTRWVQPLYTLQCSKCSVSDEQRCIHSEVCITNVLDVDSVKPSSLQGEGEKEKVPDTVRAQCALTLGMHSWSRMTSASNAASTWEMRGRRCSSLVTLHEPAGRQGCYGWGYKEKQRHT